MAHDRAAPGVYDPLETVLYFRYFIIDSPVLWAKDLHLPQTLYFIVLLWWFQCGGSKQFLLKLTKNFQIVSFKTPLDLQVIVTSFTCKIFGSQNSILYQQLISAKQFLLKFKKNFQIVSFKTPLDLQVIVTSFTCKIFELQNSILCQQLIPAKQFLLK